MTTTLTERYIAATITHLPQHSQDDIRAELQASIADAIESRADAGETLEDAERAVLTDLGNPAALAAGYADRPLHLIGPRYYLTWWRILRLLLFIVPACAVVGVVFGQVLAQASIGAVVGQAVGVGLSAVAHVCFWTTLVFMALERNDAGSLSTWDVDQLPEPQRPGTSQVDLTGSLIGLAVVTAILLWDQLFGFIWFEGQGLPFLNPQLWPFWLSALLVIIAANAVLVLVAYRRRGWTVTLAGASTALSVLALSWWLTLLGRQELVNPDFLQTVFLDNGVTADELYILAVLLGFLIAGLSVWNVIDVWRKSQGGVQL